MAEVSTFPANLRKGSNDNERAFLVPFDYLELFNLLKLILIEILREHLWIYALLEHFWLQIYYRNLTFS